MGRNQWNKDAGSTSGFTGFHRILFHGDVLLLGGEVAREKIKKVEGEMTGREGEEPGEGEEEGAVLIWRRKVGGINWIIDSGKAGSYRWRER